MALLYCIAGGAGWWMTEWQAPGGGGGWRGLPRWLTNLLLILIAAFAVFSAFNTSALVTTFATLLASVLVVKLWQERRANDYGQLLTMSLFLTVASVLSDNSFVTGAMVLVQTPALVVSAMVYQVWRARERAGAGEVSGAGERLAWKRVRAPLLAVVLLTLTAGVAIATAVFIAMPRGVLFPQFRAFSRPSVGRTVGYTDQIDLSSGAPQEESTVVVMTAQVRPSSNELASMGSAESPAYLRGAVLDTYNRGKWSCSLTPENRVKKLDMREYVGKPIIEQAVQSPESGGFPGVETVVRPRVSVTEPAQGFSVGRAYRWEFSDNTSARLDERFGSLTYASRGINGTYTVTTTPAPIFPEESRRGSVTFPEAPVRAYAERILRDQGIEPDPSLRDPAEDAGAASAFAAHLRTQFTYSRGVGVPPIVDQPVAWFLETERQGHCEFFASALAALCRSVGIDANVVAGYLATEYDPTGGDNGVGAYVVRASDAHAWVEVNTAPGVWRTFDATPEANPGFRMRERGALAGVFDRLMWAVEDVWNSRVVSYDRATQERLLNVQSSPGGLAGLISSYFEATPRERAVQAAALVVRALPVVVALVGVAGVVLWVVQRARRERAQTWALVPGWALASAHPEARRLYREVDVVLARHQVTRRVAGTLREAVRDARVPGTAAPALQHAADLLYDACFAERCDAAAMAEARRRLRSLG